MYIFVSVLTICIGQKLNRIKIKNLIHFDIVHQVLHNATRSVNPFSAKLNNLHFHRLKIVSRYRDPQLQVSENYQYWFNLRLNIWKSSCLNAHFVHNTDLTW